MAFLDGDTMAVDKNTELNGDKRSSLAAGTMQNAILGGLRFSKGSRRLILTRVVTLFLAMAPGMLCVMLHFEETAGHNPTLTRAEVPLPIAHLVIVAKELSSGIFLALLFSLAVAFIGNQFLLAGALQILHPQQSNTPKVLRQIFKSGAKIFWPYLRIAMLACLKLCLGAWLIHVCFRKLADHGTTAGWTAQSIWITLSLLEALSVFVWANFVGAFAHWCRVLIQVDGRRLVRRTILLVFRVWWCHPLQSLCFTLAIMFLASAGPATVLAAWRQAAPNTALWFGLWVLTLFILSYLWHWKVHVSRLLVEYPDMKSTREAPDVHWAIEGRVGGWIKSFFQTKSPFDRKKPCS